MPGGVGAASAKKENSYRMQDARCILLDPLQSAFAPSVDQPTNQNSQKDEHLHQSEETQLVVSYRPGVKKNGLDIKNDKDEGINVVLNSELHPRFANGFETALIGGGLYHIGLFRSDEESQSQSNDRKGNGYENEYADEGVI
jgi:hypothetical protein